MKVDEALIIGGALLAALVLSKGRGISSIFKKPSIPFMPLENKTINFIEKFPTLNTYQQFFPVKETNVQLKNIINIEEEKKEERIGYLQNELDKTRGYISRLSMIEEPDQFKKISPVNSTGINLLKKFDDSFNYYKRVWTGEKGPLSSVSIYPDFKLLLTQNNRNIISQQAQYEITQQNIAKADEFSIRQQKGIDEINEEYQTRFGNLRRYG